MDYLPQNPAILVSSINMLLRDEGTLEDFEERYEGKYNSPEDFAEYPERSPDGTGEAASA